jgi:hypothetical protein
MEGESRIKKSNFQYPISNIQFLTPIFPPKKPQKSKKCADAKKTEPKRLSQKYGFFATQTQTFTQSSHFSLIR